MPPTPQGGGLQRERVLRPSQLSPSSAPPNYKAAEAWLRQEEAYHSHPEASLPVSMRVRGCSPGRWPLTHAQSQRECPAPQTQGAAQGLSTCAEFCTQPRGRLPAATSGLLERWGTLQTKPGQAECTCGPCKEQTADPSPVNHFRVCMCVMTPQLVAMIGQQLLMPVRSRRTCLHCRVTLSL